MARRRDADADGIARLCPWFPKHSPFDPADLSIPREKVRAHSDEWQRLRTRYYPEGLRAGVCTNSNDPKTWTPGPQAGHGALVLDDALQGSTTGTRSGGAFVAGGWQVTEKDDTLYWHVPTIAKGAAEFDVRGLRPNERRAGMEDKAELYHIVNNLVHGEIQIEGGKANVHDNRTGRLDGFCADPPSGNLALTPAAARVIDQGVPLLEVTDDIRGRPRSNRPDLGAWEFDGKLNE